MEDKSNNEYDLLAKIKKANKQHFNMNITQNNTFNHENNNTNEVNRRRSSFNFFRRHSHSPVKEKLFSPTNEIENLKIEKYSEQEEITNEQYKLILKIQSVKSIIANLNKSLRENQKITSFIKERSKTLNKQQNIIEDNINRIKKLMKPKQKKHVKYNQFIPLSAIYNYSTKKIYRYYQLFEVVSNSNFCYSKQSTDTRVQTTTNRLINRYKFTQIEDKYLSNDWKDIDWKQIGNYEINRDVIECFVRKLELTGFYQYKKWSITEDMILKKAILYYGPRNWQQISYCLEGRNNSQCFHRWMKGINPKIKRSKWTLDEDLTLGIALKIYGNNKWAKISYHIPNRTDIQCRERYCNILDPKLTDVKWSIEEDLKLISLQAQYGNKWSLIAKSFGDRTDNTCWRRFKFIKMINSASNISNNLSSLSYNALSELENSLPVSQLINDNYYDEEEDYDNFDEDEYEEIEEEVEEAEEEENIKSNKKLKFSTKEDLLKIISKPVKTVSLNNIFLKSETKINNSKLLNKKRENNRNVDLVSTKPDDKVRKIFIIEKSSIQNQIEEIN